MTKKNKPQKPHGSVPGAGGLPLDLNECFGKIKAPLKTSYPKNTLSVIMIVKDEAGNIRDAVESFRPVADEIVINDTGSSDGTQEILLQLGVKWFQTEWQDDFSLARNQSIEKATSSWLIWMDADDRIPEDQVENFLKLKTAPLDRIFGFQVINTQAGQPFGTRFMQNRMFPNHPDLRFERRIHEQIMFAAARMGLHAIYTETTIHHMGYEDTEKKKVKAHRNLSLVEKESHLLGKEPAFSMSCGDSYYILEQWEKGIDAYRKTFEIPHLKKINKDIYAVLPCCIGTGYLKLGRPGDALEWFEKAIGLNPKNLEAVYYRGEALAALSRTEEAMEAYRQAVDMPLSFASTGSQYDTVKMYSYHYLSRLLMQAGRYEEAVEVIKKMHKTYPLVLESWDSLGDCYRQTGRPQQAVEAWKECVRLNPARLPEVHKKLLTELLGQGQASDFAVYLAQAKKQFPGHNWEITPAGGGESSDRKTGASLCMIVKNEEKTLDACLSSARGLFDEIIIVDTGSDDNTGKVAKSHGARLLTSPWDNDFSRARNVSLEPARGRWIMWLDADDIIPQKEKEAIRLLLQGPPDRAYGFLIQSSPDRGITGTVFNQIRLFPNRPDIRFTSPVHEQVLPSLEAAGIPVEYTRLRIIHTGYTDPESSRKKQLRNREILMDQINRGENVTPVTCYSYAHACMDLGDNENALEWFLRAVELAEQTNTDPHIIQIGPAKTAVALANLKRYQEALGVLKVGLEQPDIQPETVLVKAQVEEAIGNQEEAHTWYVRLLEIEEKTTFIPVDYKLIKIKALEFLGHYWNRKGNDTLAVTLLKAGLAIKQGGDFTGKDLERVYKEAGVMSQ
ncbi:glycosyltransferase [Fibrobacterota bacterium]